MGIAALPHCLPRIALRGVEHPSITSNAENLDTNRLFPSIRPFIGPSVCPPVRSFCRAGGTADLVLVPVQDPSSGRHESCGRLRALRGGEGEGMIKCFVL